MIYSKVKLILFKKIRKSLIKFLPEIEKSKNMLYSGNKCDMVNIINPYHIRDTSIGKGTYISMNSFITKTKIGKFCSIGPHFLCGWGVHPIDGISTSPFFYSLKKQNGYTLAEKSLFKERKAIQIGNDVFIGANVTILDGVSIGDGAVIGAGAIVSKDIPDYAVAVGNPIKIIKYRFSEDKCIKLKEIAWWNFSDKKLKKVNKYFFDIDKFIEEEY